MRTRHWSKRGIFALVVGTVIVLASGTLSVAAAAP